MVTAGRRGEHRRVPSPEELVRIHTAGINPVTAAGDVTQNEFASFARSAGIRSATGFSSATRIIAAAHMEPTHIALSRVTLNVSGTFGTPLELGRSFTNAEIENGEPVAVLGEAAWDRMFHRDGAILGTSVTIDGAPHTVIGVVRGASYPPGTDVSGP